MSHKQQQAFCASVKAMFPGKFSNARVLDVGSMDVNGGTRHLFSGGSYLGCDVHPGKAVDHVGAAWTVPGIFDVVISTECLEHDPTWRKTMWAMEERVAPGGLLIVTCAGPGRGEHGTRRHPINGMVCTGDYYGNLTPMDLMSNLNTGLWRRYSATYSDDNCDTYLWALKR
jgi:hypothetical protein